MRLRHLEVAGRKRGTAAMTGLGLGELRALHWEDIDWAGSNIRVHRNVETNYQPDHTAGLVGLCVASRVRTQFTDLSNGESSVTAAESKTAPIGAASRAVGA